MNITKIFSLTHLLYRQHKQQFQNILTTSQLHYSRDPIGREDQRTMFHQSVGRGMHMHNQSINGEEKRKIAENLETLKERREKQSDDPGR